MIILLSGCATKSEVSTLKDNTNYLINEIEKSTLKEQELATKLTILELDGKKNTQQYKNIQEEIISIKNYISSSNNKLTELEKQGKLNSEQIANIFKILEKYETTNKNNIEKFKKEWDEIGRNYKNGGLKK